MKINAISADFATQKSRNVKKINSSNPTEQTAEKNGMSMISFRSGNPRHIAHFVAEEPLFGMAGGGVGTVSNDYNFLDKDIDKIAKIIPLYNQEVKYKEDLDSVSGKSKGVLGQGVQVRTIPSNLPEGHPFKGQEGTAFLTPEKIDKTTDLTKFLEEKKGKIFLLDEIQSSSMDWGLEKDVPIKMYKARKDENLKKAMTGRGMPAELQQKLEFIFPYVDSTASMPKPYADGFSYSTSNGDDLAKRFSSGWKGQEYAKFNKAGVELLPSLKEKMGFDPRYILCSDGQSMFTMHYAAQKNAAGDSYWMDKFLGGVGHNMNAGYDQPMGARQAIVNLGATKEEIVKLINSKEYIEALQTGREEDFLRETVLKNFNNERSGLNAYGVPIHYAKKGYVPMITTVSEGYHQSIISNDLVSTMYEDLKELDKLGRFKGLTNPLMDPSVTPFKDSILQAGYKNDVKLKLANGSEVTVPKFQVFDESKKYDLKHVREIKRQNKINLFDRFDPKYIGAQSYNSAKNEWQQAGTGRMEILAGASGRKAKIYGSIDKKYIDALKNGKDIKLVVSWGRGDIQKGMDTVIDAFEKYASKDPDAVLLLGGPMENEEALAVVEKFKSKMHKPELAGRMAFMDGFTPGKDFAMAADVALLPSRFAPCELTDLEAKKALCTPIVPNVQGMAQKNFDPSIPEEMKLMDGYKGKHEFFMSEEVAMKAANEEAKTEFNNAKNTIVKEIKGKYKGQVGKDMPEELFNKTIKDNKDYQKALRKLRDSVISDEMAECLERALVKDRNTDIPEKILKNQVDANTTWFGNAWLSKTGKSSGDLYMEYHFKNSGKNITKDDLIKLDFSGITDKESKITQKAKKWFNFKSRQGKIALGTIAGIAALGGLGYAGYKSGWLSPKFEEQKKCGHLSCIG